MANCHWHWCESMRGGAHLSCSCSGGMLLWKTRSSLYRLRLWWPSKKEGSCMEGGVGTLQHHQWSRGQPEPSTYLIPQPAQHKRQVSWCG